MARFQNSIALAKSSWQVLRDDKQLTILPLLSLLSTIVLAVAVLLPIGLIARDGSGNYDGSKPLVWVLGFLGSVALTYIVVFFNAALVFAANSRFQGEAVSVSDAIHAASARSHVLLPWAIVSATVSVVLRAVEQRGGIIGRIVGSIAGVAWSVVTFLVLPVLVFEGIGPIAAVKRSGQLFKHTWGENLMTNAGIGIVGFIGVVAGVVPLLLFLAVGGPIAVLGIALFVLWCVAVLLVTSTLTGIFQVALYRFATGAPVPGFEPAQLSGSFRTRARTPGRGLFGGGSGGGFPAA
ncbi:MAG: putative rane protein [Actinomycetia bacterium]|jgi:hypothetical protein|nr:putative rane protein [Actinomycetes bacterium]